MNYYLVSVIDILNLQSNPTIKNLKQFKRKENAMGALMDVAKELVEQNGGKRQLDYALTKENLVDITKASSTVYPLGFNIKKEDWFWRNSSTR